MVLLKTKYQNRLEIDNDVRCFLSCTQPRLKLLITKKKQTASTFLLNAFVIKNDLVFLCDYFGLEAIIVAVFLKRVGLIDIYVVYMCNTTVTDQHLDALTSEENNTLS